MLVPFVESGFCGPDGFGDGELGVGCGRRDGGEAGSQRAVIETGIEDGGSQTLGSSAIAMSFRDSRDEAMQAQATQVVGDAAGGVLARLMPEQCGEVLANILVVEGSPDAEEEEQGIEQGLNPWSGTAQSRGTLVVDGDGSLQVLEGRLADEAVVTDTLDVEQTSVGGKADLAHFGEVVDLSADGEVAVGVVWGLRSKSLL